MRIGMARARRISQALFLILFFSLLIKTEYAGVNEIPYPVKIFLDFDPLILITTYLASHGILKPLLLSVILIAVTAIFGKIFCGWACPMGTLNHYVSHFKRARLKEQADGNWSPWQDTKFYILVGVIAASVLGLQLAGLIDPLSLIIRSLSISILPAVNLAIRSVFDALYFTDVGPITAVSEPVYAFLKKTILAFEQPHFQWNLFIGSIFILALALNLRTIRFWCRYLCPLGALLGLLARASILGLEQSEECDGCNRCVRRCQGGDNPNVAGGWKSHECHVCANCLEGCPAGALKFKLFPKKPGPVGDLDLGRRRLVLAALGGALAIPLIRPNPVRATNNPALIRPPGAVGEREFLRKCVRCGECMKVCLTNGLHPTFLEAGFEGIWSPILVSRIGYCEYSCTLCGQVCPTGAIKNLDVETKRLVKIGLAFVDKGRCLPYAFATPCIVCEEHCPTPVKAIWLEDAVVRARDGSEVRVQLPRVDPELCIGCGICENKCPVADRAAIVVTSVGESRSSENRMILSPRNSGY